VLTFARRSVNHHRAQRTFRPPETAGSQHALAHLCHYSASPARVPDGRRRRPSTQALNNKPVDATSLVLFDHAVPRGLTKGREIRDRTRIGGKNLQSAALWQAS